LDPSYNLRTMRTDFYEFLEFYNANRNKYEYESK